jgi:hypothetical protein
VFFINLKPFVLSLSKHLSFLNKPFDKLRANGIFKGGFKKYLALAQAHQNWFLGNQNRNPVRLASRLLGRNPTRFARR